jgi:hypothetical protein
MATTIESRGPEALKFFKMFFLVAALYDMVLGGVFFLFYGPVFEMMGVELPNNASYIHLNAGFVFVQGVGYWFVYRNMVRNVDLVKVGIIYKTVYTLVAVYYFAIGQLPDAIFAWFALFDVLFIVGFIRFLMLAQPAAVEARAQG